MSPSNRSTAETWAFHAATSYVPAAGPPPGSHIMMGHPPKLESPFWRADPSIEPIPYKIYEDLPRVPLPREFAPATRSVLDALATPVSAGGPRLFPGVGGAAPAGTLPTLETLARLGLFSNGLLNRRSRLASGRLVEYRTAAATGARYHLEVYFACRDLAGVPAGVYQYAADEHCLRVLRDGDFRAALVQASGNEPFLARSPLIVIISSTFWRNAYTYKARTYRHAFWDCGTTLAQLTGVATSLELPTRIVLGFADHQVNRVLGLDGERESALVMCGIGQESPSGPTAAQQVPPVHHAVRPISSREVIFSAIGQMHHASSLDSAEEAAAWRSAPLRRRVSPSSAEGIQLAPIEAEQWPRTSIEDVVLSRRSTRHYDADTPLGFAALSTVLALSEMPIPLDCLDASAPPLHDQYLIIHAVGDLQPGVYVHHSATRQLELLRAGDFRRTSEYLAVQQAYAGQAHVNAYYLADLNSVLGHYGNRGYRLAQLEASLSAGRLNLAAHALGLGGVGSTAYDDDVIRFFSPHAAGKTYLFVTVFGTRRSRAQTA